jgi:hypothetical protein
MVIASGWLGGCGGTVDQPTGGGIASNTPVRQGPAAPDASTSPTLTVLATGPGEPAYIVVRDGHLYWTSNADTGKVLTMPTTGGTLVTLATSVSASHLAVDASNVYFTQQVDRVGIAGQQAPVMSVPREGGETRIVTASPWAFGVAVDGSDVYYAGAVEGDSSLTQTALVRTPLGGGSPSPLVSSLFLGDIAVGAGGVFWADISGTLYRWALDGTGTTKLASAPPSSGEYLGIGMGGIAVSGATVYWGATETLTATPAGGGDSITLASMPHTWIADVVTDDAFVYFTTVPDDMSVGRGTVMKVAHGGGEPVTLASGLSFPFGLAVDAAGVYVTDPVDGAVERITDD